jgi:hypothetical protein
MLNFSLRLRLLSLIVTMCVANSTMGFDVFWDGGTGPWTNGSNWDIEATPDGGLEDVAVINNGGTATLNTLAPDGAAGLALGYAVGASGTLIIQNGGSLTLIETAGAAVNVPPNGAANIGFEGGTGGEGDSGLLEIQGGGSLTAVYFDINQHGTLRIGTGTGAATATTSTGSLFSNGTLEVIGPGHNVSIAANLNFEEKAEGNSRYVPHITALNNGISVIDVTGNAVLGGSIVPVFDGYTPQVGDSWDLIDATEVQGDIDVDPSNAPAAAPGTLYTTRVVTGGNGQILQLGLEAFATLRVNTSTGAVSLVSESGDPIDMVGYSILSPAGNLNPAGWNSLTEKNLTGWEEAGGTATAVSELNAENSLALTTTPINLGSSLYVPPTEFGIAPDIAFEYGVDGAMTATEGIVEYTGANAVNNLMLTVDPTSGEGQLKNSSGFVIDLLGYSILSDSGSLDATSWMSLEEHGAAGWDEAASDEFSLNELVPLDPAATLTAQQAYSLGNIFETSGSRDLELEFTMLVDGVPEIRQGVVQYAEIVAIPGDYNNDGAVSLADYTVWRDNLGAVDESAINNNGDGGGITISDYTFWKSSFGNPGAGAGAWAAASAPVPEPSALASILIAFFGLSLAYVRQRALCRG